MKPNAVPSRLPALIKAKRRGKGLGLRAAAQESGVSSSTLSRLERGNLTTLPDLDTLKKLAIWLNLSLDEMLQTERQKSNGLPEFTTPEAIEVHLRADKNLSPETAKALADAFKILYMQFTEGKVGK